MDIASIEEKIQGVAVQIRDNISNILRLNGGDNGLIAAMRYSSLAPGKMVRAYLVSEFSKILGVSHSSFVNIATAIELIHCYSLIHDDLPVMDNDDYRRGQESSHKKFGEANAILVGDAMQALAFEVLASDDTSDDPKRIVKLISKLAEASGYNGMVGGQYLDMNRESKNVDEVTHMQKLKTGKLIEFSCMSPSIIARTDKKIESKILSFSRNVGFAYQIRDDILDVKGKNIGKTTGKDKKSGKKNLVDFLSLDSAQTHLEALLTQAKSNLEIFGNEASDIISFVDYLALREK